MNSWKEDLKDAEKFLKKNPPNTIKCAEIILRAFESSLRVMFFQLSLCLNSPEAVVFGVHFLIKSTDPATSHGLSVGWGAIEIAAHVIKGLAALSREGRKKMIKDAEKFFLKMDALSKSDQMEHIEKTLEEVIEYKMSTLNPSSESVPVPKIIAESESLHKLLKSFQFDLWGGVAKFL